MNDVSVVVVKSEGDEERDRDHPLVEDQIVRGKEDPGDDATWNIAHASGNVDGGGNGGGRDPEVHANGGGHVAVAVSAPTGQSVPPVVATC